MLVVAGTLLNVTALVLFGVSNSKDFNALPYAAVVLGLGGITFHLAQFHISNLFPRNRGLISSLLVAGFTGCGIIFYFLNLIFDSAGGTRCELRYPKLANIFLRPLLLLCGVSVMSGNYRGLVFHVAY
jgi:nitrate/nitrite transporter NarK